MNHKTFSAASITALDDAINAYIGRQTLDGRSIERMVNFYQTYLSAGTFYASIIYTQTTLSNN